MTLKTLDSVVSVAASVITALLKTALLIWSYLSFLGINIVTTSFRRNQEK